MTTIEKQTFIYRTLIEFAQSHNGATPSKKALWSLCVAKGLNIAYKNFYKHLSKIQSIEYRDKVLIVVDSLWACPPDGSFKVKPFTIRGHKANIPSDAKLDPSSRTTFVIVGERDGFRCAHCGTDKTLEIDHILPRSIGGLDSLDNLQLLCRTCNLNKSNGVDNGTQGKTT